MTIIGAVKRLSLVALAMLCCGGGLHLVAQGCGGAEKAALPRFEVATIKPFGPQGGIAGLLSYPGGRIVAGHLNIRALLMYACDVQMFQVTGGPGWVDSEFFDLEAKPPEDSLSARSNPANPKLPPACEQKQMLLALLFDRFQLKYHVEKKEGPVYLLERGKIELKLVPPKDAQAFPWFGGLEGGAVRFPTGIAGTNLSMPQLAERLARYLERPVIDRTEMPGSFDFRYKLNEIDPATPYFRDDIISAIESSIGAIGLKLRSAKEPIETIVIDSVQEPSAN